MYAIIRSGGKQAKVRVGDVVDVERLRAEGEITLTPVLVVDGKGKVYSSRSELKTAKVTAKVVGESAGDKIDIFKYKAKTGYRRRGGHRQKYTRIEVTKIQPPKAPKAAPASEEAESQPAETEKAPAAKAKAATKPKAPAAKAATNPKAPATKAKAATKPKPATKKASSKQAEESGEEG